MLISGGRRSVEVNGMLNIADTNINEVDVTSFVGLHIDKHLT